MKKFLKRTLSIFLVVVMALGAAPLAGFVGLELPEFNWHKFKANAASTTESAPEIYENTDLVYGNNGTITRIEWLHNLTVLFEMSVSSDNLPDNYFFDLDETSEYYKDAMLAVEFGVVDIPAGENINPTAKATREFAAQTLNFCLGFQLENPSYTFSDIDAVTYDDDAQVALNRGWFSLSSGKFNPEQVVTTAEVNKMIADTLAVLAESVIDYDKEDSFEFADDVIVVPQETYVEITDTQVSIWECPVEIKTGDVFAVFSGELPVTYTATAVKKSGNVTIVNVEDDENEDSVSSIEASGSEDIGLSEFVPAEGVNVISSSEDDQIQTFSVVNINKPIKLNKRIEITEGTYATANITLSNLKLDYDISTFEGNYDVLLTGDASIDFGVSIDLMKVNGLERSIYLGYVPIAGGLGDISVTMNYNISGSVDYVTKGKISVGFSYNSSQFRTVKRFEKEDYSVVWLFDADINLEIRATLDLHAVEGYIYAKIGIKGFCKVEVFGDDSLPSNCVTMRAWLYAKIGAYVTIGTGPFKEKFGDSYDIFNENNSPIRIYTHYEDDVEVTTCTRTGKKLYYTPATSRYGYGATSNAKSWGYDSTGAVYTRYEYTLNDNNQATITKYYGNSGSVIIPKSIDGYDVVAVGKEAFKGNSYLVSVVIPDTVTEIGNSAFENCANLSSVQLSKSVETIKYQAFADCISLTYIDIPKSLDKCTALAGSLKGPFSGCSNLKNVSFEKGATKIPCYLFAACDGIESIIIPDTVTLIENCAFYGCYNLSNIVIGSSVNSILSEAFMNCSSLDTVIIPDSVTEIGSSVFENCTNLSNVQLSKSLKKMYTRVFRNCTSLTSIEIPKSLDTCAGFYGNPIGPFEDCINLKNVTFEEGTTQIAAYLFGYCNGIESITIPETVTVIESCAFYNCENLSSITIGAFVTEIGNEAFRECVKLKSITLPDNLVYIRAEAFKHCIGLTEIVIPDSVVEIGSSAFEDCINLSTVKLSKTIEKIYGKAFANCTSLTSIEIPKSLDSCSGSSGNPIGPFAYCSNLKNVSFEKGVTKIPCYLFAACDGIESIIIPDIVTLIENDAFNDCANLNSIKFGNSINEIGKNAFKDCVNIENINVPSNVKQVYSSAFSGCTSLKSAEFKNADTTIGAYAFDGCSKLETVKLPENLAEIENYTFRNCKVLKNINFSEKLTSIGQYAFYECDALTKAVIPDNVTSLGKYAFYGCENLSKIDFGIGLTTIPDSAFRLLPSLTEVYLPRFLTTIAANAFAENTKLTEVAVPSTVTSIKDNSFSYPTRLTFYGIPESYAETHANSRGISFVDVSELKIDTIKFDKPNYVFSATGTGTKFVADMTIEPDVSVEPITFTSSDAKIVTVSNGLITVKGYGTATITATTESGKTASCQITINRSVTGVSLDKSTLSIKEGSSATLAATVKPTNATNKNISWISTDTSVATVSSDGVITAVAPGTATVIVKTEDGAYTANCVVTVTSSVVTLDSITVKSNPSKTTYAIGENLNTSGLVLTAKYTDGSSRLVNSGFACSGFNSSTAGTKTVTVSYGGKTTTFTITVSATATPDEPSTETYTVKWIVDGNTTTQTYKEGDRIVKPSNPPKSGYTFKGWTPDVPSIMPAYDLTFTAVFEKNADPAIPSEPPKADVINHPTQTTISYGDAIILHVDASKIPDGGKVEWTADNSNFKYSANGDTCRIDPNKSGSTTFTATVYDAQGNAVAKDEQTMTSKAGFFDKIIAFFKKLFGLTKVIQQSLNTIY